MRVVIYVTGESDKRVVPGLLQAALRVRTTADVRVKAVRRGGWPGLAAALADDARVQLEAPGVTDLACVAGLADLSDPKEYPLGVDSVEHRAAWMRERLGALPEDERFRFFVAVHDIEAWLLAQPEVFPTEVRDAVSELAADPEGVDHGKPPGKVLEALYPECLGRSYNKVIDGAALLRKLDPERVYERRPAFKRMVDELVALVTRAMPPP